MTVAETWLAHRVQRYHTNPHLARIGQTNADHAHGVASIVAQLFPDASAELLRAALHHDAGERAAGDLSTTFKLANPVIAEAHAAFEAGARDRLISWPALSVEDERRLKLCDRLEAVLFAAFHRPGLLQRHDWADYTADMIAMADRLGVYTPVAEAVERMQDIGWA